MTKREFLDKMREALSNDLAEPAVRENIRKVRRDWLL